MTGLPQELHECPDGVEETTDLLVALDRCFGDGFGRLGGDALSALESVSDAFIGTPLAARLEEAQAAVSESRFESEAFETIAAARASMQGARYDAILDHACEVYGWSRPTVDPDEPDDLDEEVGTLLSSTQEWLTELAIAGFGALEEDTVAPFESTVRRLKLRADTRPLGTLLTGFVRELRRHTPTASAEHVPVTRWTDFWTRAMVHATHPPGPVDFQTISGELHPLGSELRHHDTAVSVVAYGLLESDDVDGERLVRTTVSTGKVDAISGNRLWQVFPDHITPLLSALAENHTVAFSDADLRSTGDLLLGRSLSQGEELDKLDHFEERFADPTGIDLVVPDQRPLDRHPSRIALPAYLENYEVDDDRHPATMEFDDAPSLVLDTDRISPYSGIEDEHVLGSKRLGGLLRFDGGRWTVQPLVETKRSKRVYTALDAKPEKDSDLEETLQERADVLLREKA